MRIARFICSLLLAVGILAIPAPSRAQIAVGISVRFGPPELPVYEQKSLRRIQQTRRNRGTEKVGISNK